MEKIVYHVTRRYEESYDIYEDEILEYLWRTGKFAGASDGLAYFETHRQEVLDAIEAHRDVDVDLLICTDVICEVDYGGWKD